MENAKLTPLTHHEILRLVAPFSRRERAVDLVSSDRARRLLVFRAVEHAGDPALRERLLLDLSDPEQSVLVREVTAADGLSATASATGNDLGALLDRLLSLPPQAHYRAVDGVRVADSFRDDQAAGERWLLVSCAARVGELGMTLDARTVIGEPMAVKLAARTAALTFDPPDDLLALVGRRWRVLREFDGVWTSTLTAPVREPARSRVAQAQFGAAVGHLASVFSVAPADYHLRYRRARWRVYLRRFMPLLACVGAVAALPLIDRYVLTGDAALHPGFLMLTPLMFAGVLLATWREMPTIEVPPRPRPLGHQAWSADLLADATDGAALGAIADADADADADAASDAARQGSSARV